MIYRVLTPLIYRFRPPQAGNDVATVSTRVRALDFGDIEDLRAKHGGTADVHPLPDPALTKPSLTVRPHRDAAKARALKGLIRNREET